LHIKQNAFDRQLIEENLQDQLEASKKALDISAEGTKQQLAAQIALICAQAGLDIKDAGQNPAKIAAIQAQANKDILDQQTSFQRMLADLRKADAGSINQSSNARCYPFGTACTPAKINHRGG